MGSNEIVSDELKTWISWHLAAVSQLKRGNTLNGDKIRGLIAECECFDGHSRDRVDYIW